MTGLRRVRITFLLMVAIAVASTGVLMRAVEWRASPIAGATVATAGVVAAIAVTLAARILVVTGNRP